MVGLGKNKNKKQHNDNKNHVTYQKTKIRITKNFSSKNMQAINI